MMAFDSVSADRIGCYGGPPTNPGRKVFPERGTPDKTQWIENWEKMDAPAESFPA